MPFVALLRGQRVNALELTGQQWSGLRASDDYASLVFPGCGIRATAKTSSRGRRFFAHHTTLECNEPHLNETPQHRMMKEAIARLIDSQPGWRALVEYPGPSREWVADVLAVSDSGRRIVFEVQLTQQGDPDFEQRSQVRFDAGALPVWITPHQPAAYPRLPLISTGFRKSSPLPEDLDELLTELSTGSTGRRTTLRSRILFYLENDRPWTHGDPRYQHEQRATAQQQSQERESVRIQQVSKEERKKQQRAATFVRSAFNPESVHPKVRFPRDNRQALWVVGVRCHRCGDAYYVWSVQDPDRFLRAYSPKPGRPEDRPEIRGVVERWHAQLHKPFPLAVLGRTQAERYKSRARTYFACPSCRRISDSYLHLIPSEKWLLLPGFSTASAPTEDFEDMVRRAQRRREHRNN